MEYMLSYRDYAVVLRHCNLSEADKIITLLTVEHGLVRMVARGIRRTRSKFGARLEIFNSVDVMVHPPRTADGLGIILSVDQLHSPSGVLSADYEKFTAACVLVETAECLAGVEFSPVARLVNLTIHALEAIAAGNRAAELILTAYLIRAMDYSGWLPSLYCCAVCAVSGPHDDFHVPTGGVVCKNCRPVGYISPGHNIIFALDAIYRGKWENVPEDSQLHHTVLKLMTRYVHWHINRQVTSLHAFSFRDHFLVSNIINSFQI